MNREKMIELFKNEYGVDNREIKTFLSPGRVNLIGEHIDYNGGFVFPGALTVGIYAALSLRDDNKIRMRSKNVAGEVIVDLDEDLVYKKEDDWGNYPKGVIKALKDLGHEVPGMDIVLYSNIPDGAGLSSSAALEVLMAYIILYLENPEQIDRVEIAKLCQKVENEFVGVNCGIMDQFAVAVGKKDHAILLDCDSLYYEYAPLNLGEYSLVIMSTNKRRELADSKYNERRSECETALKEIQTVKNISSLGELTEEEFEEVKSSIADPIRIKRAKHAVYENQRTLKAVKALENNDLALFGQLMNDSHVSLRDDYEVTGIELDTLVSLAWECEGVVGSRMTGAGFGGCTVSIVKEDCIDNFVSTITPKYAEKIGYEPSFYIVSISDGTRKLS